MGWTGRGSNPGVGEIFRTCSDRPWVPSSLLYNGYRVFPRGKERLERETEPSPLSSVGVKKEYSYTSTPPMDRTACTEPQCLYKGALYLTFLWHNFLHVVLMYTYFIYFFPFPKYSSVSPGQHSLVPRVTRLRSERPGNCTLRSESLCGLRHKQIRRKCLRIKLNGLRPV